MDIYDFLTLLCGLAFFLFGMNVMSTNLEKMAGGSLSSLLKKVTSNKFRSLLLGLVITAVIQSSSAVTVMLVGLVNSGIMEFGQTVSILLGVNIGTTITGWIMSLMGISSEEFSIFSVLSPDFFVPVLAFVGAILRTFFKKEKTKDIGTILLGFSVLMYGMTLMSDSMDAITQTEGFQSILTMFSNPVLALLVSVVFTAVIQSSSAAIGIYQALALNGALTMKMVIPLVIGANVGTVITGIISAVGTNRDSKRVVATSAFINVFGAVIFMIIYFGIIGNIIPSFMAMEASAVSIAVVHTIFNIVNALILFPLQDKLVLFIDKLIPDKEGDKVHFLDERLLNTPSAAINECDRLANEMSYIAEESVLKALSLLRHYDAKVAKTIEVDEDSLDRYDDKLTSFLARLQRTSLSEIDAAKAARMTHAITNFERMGDHALNIHDDIIKLHNSGEDLNDESVSELETLIDAVTEVLDLAIFAYNDDNMETASYIEPLEETIDKIIAISQDNETTRLEREETSLMKGMTISDIYGNMERIADHCSNIGLCVIEFHAEKFNSHKYLAKIKHESAEFQEKFEVYQEKYKVEKYS